MMTRPAQMAAPWRIGVALLGSLALLAGTARAAVTAAGAEARFTELLNEARGQAGQPPLVRDPGLDAVAREWSVEMARRGSLVHRPDLAARVAQVEPARRAWGENIAWRQSGRGLTDADVVAVHSGLMASPGHHENIMGDYNRVGVGVEVAGNTLWVTFDFLRGPPLAAAPPAIAPGAPPAPAGSAAPTGWFRMTRGPRNRLRIAGWAIDPDTDRPIRVRIRVGGLTKDRLASRARRDVLRVYPHHGARHGFLLVTKARRGTLVCIDGVDASTGTAVRLACRRVRR